MYITRASRRDRSPSEARARSVQVEAVGWNEMRSEEAQAGVVAGFKTCGYERLAGCLAGDVRFRADGSGPRAPEVLVGAGAAAAWRPICSHFFSANQQGAAAFCGRLGFARFGVGNLQRL